MRRRSLAQLVAALLALVVGVVCAAAAGYVAIASTVADNCSDGAESVCSRSGWLVPLAVALLAASIASLVACVFMLGQLAEIRAEAREPAQRTR